MSRPNLEIVGEAEKREVSDGSVSLVVPIRLTRRCGRRLVQMQNAPEANRRWDKQKTALQVALKRAYLWLALLEQGEVASLSDIARKEKTDVSYIARVLNLTALAPEIIEAILDDALPDAANLNSLAINPPTFWTHQVVRLQRESFIYD
ncbi:MULTISPECIES: LacI family transcriptional regulator [unclassified Lysobacter]|uniref:LacI family transcriptional regulator n=1 Tax=unclassified Lysobacter TaxID=2635362 RepID=UPI001BE86EE2|nr:MULTISPECIES: LacI family transcriptional regulator [unclassified Lysobacter]MBT2748282.1 LacI family transcriptional regulator [Lysobacter sp. ISL-42]MBT2749951.1 LacI family transcriptional regulator [Lysobacter sp. ISL-50]MBT2781279.1 LacI family transcriptional regulator [Lysobacter sp. ISL-52]